MRKFVYQTLHPEIFHGHRAKAPFFEGWYYKLVDKSEEHRFAVIPGIFITQDTSKNHAFIQVLDGQSGKATYHEFPETAFEAHPERFDVRIGNNHFYRDGFEINIQDEHLQLSGQVTFANQVPWPRTIFSPGIMGWYAWVPFMECYHGIVSLDHSIAGGLQFNGHNIDFSSGLGYIEKDWGQAFPSSYIWMQSNHFANPGTSLTASIANIPFLGRSFPGFLIGLWHNGTLHRFTTYTGAKTQDLHVTEKYVNWTISDHTHRIVISAKRTSGSLLKAPIRTEMHKRIEESLDSAVHVTLFNKNNNLIFEGEGRNAGLEVYGDMSELTP